MASERRSAVAGILIFVILVVGGYVAVREVASAELSNVTRPRPISLPTPSITVPQLNTQSNWYCSQYSPSSPAPTTSATRSTC